jgi:TPR repeat protein
VDIERLQADAEAGNVVSQGVLGLLYLFGEDVSQDYPQALRWLTKAWERGAARPAVWLGTMYEKGLAVSVDLERARELYQHGAERGELHGCIFLARLLARGRLGAPDLASARHWYSAALELGVTDGPELEEAQAFIAS